MSNFGFVLASLMDLLSDSISFFRVAISSLRSFNLSTSSV